MAATEQEVTEFVHKALGDVGAALTASLVVVGDKLGLYKALAGSGGLTPAELAAQTKTSERYVREWCSAQAAAGYVTYDPASGRFSLPDAHAGLSSSVSATACVLGGFQGMTAAMRVTPRIVEAFRTGAGVGWHEQDPELFTGVETE